MANAVATATILNPPQYSIGSNTVDYYYTLSVSPSPATYVVGGIQIAFPSNLAQVTYKSSIIAGWAFSVAQLAATNQNFYSINIVGGTTGAGPTGILLQIFQGTAELTAVAIPAGISNDTIRLLLTCSRR